MQQVETNRLLCEASTKTLARSPLSQRGCDPRPATHASLQLADEAVPSQPSPHLVKGLWVVVVVVVGAKVGDEGLRHLVQQRTQPEGYRDLRPAVAHGATARQGRGGMCG